MRIQWGEFGSSKRKEGRFKGRGKQGLRASFLASARTGNMQCRCMAPCLRSSFFSAPFLHPEGDVPFETSFYATVTVRLLRRCYTYHAERHGYEWRSYGPRILLCILLSNVLSRFFDGQPERFLRFPPDATSILPSEETAPSFRQLYLVFCSRNGSP